MSQTGLATRRGHDEADIWSEDPRWVHPKRGDRAARRERLQAAESRWTQPGHHPMPVGAAYDLDAAARHDLDPAARYDLDPAAHYDLDPADLDPAAGYGPGEHADRRTVKITGRGTERLPAPRPRTARAGGVLARHERPGFRPDRVAMWAVLLGALLVLMAATSAHAAVLVTQLPH